MPPNGRDPRDPLSAGAATRAPPRCPACQLQLCKGRGEPPHAALTAVRHDGIASRDSRFACQTCGATLVRTEDRTRPEWFHRR